jgi:hypothetical protein
MEYPRTFTDGLGREWTLEFSLAAGRRLQEFAGVTTEQLVPDPRAKNKEDAVLPVVNLLGDPFQAFGVFYALVKPAADAKGLSRDQLLEGFTDDSVSERLSKAIIGALLFFSRNAPQKTAALRTLAANWDQFLGRINKRIESGMSKLDFGAALDAMPEIDVEGLNRQIAERSRSFATGSAASSGSTPKPIPCVS